MNHLTTVQKIQKSTTKCGRRNLYRTKVFESPLTRANIRYLDKIQGITESKKEWGNSNNRG